MCANNACDSYWNPRYTPIAYVTVLLAFDYWYTAYLIATLP